MKVSISHADIAPLKAHLSALVPTAKSSHRVEALARGLGFGSNAAMRAVLEQSPSACSIDERAFLAFLRDYGQAEVAWGALSQAVVAAKFGDQQAAIAAVRSREPELCTNGYRTRDLDDFEGRREAMTDAGHVFEFVRAIAFLQTRQKSKTLVRKATSYGWKHEAERFHKDASPGENPYVSNGMFLAAALHLGFAVKRDGQSPNGFVGIAASGPARPSNVLAGSLRGPKKKAAWRNMMVAAINAGLDQGLFGLAEDDNRWAGEDATYGFDFDDLPALAHVRDIGFGELSIHVALEPTDRAPQFIRTHNAGFVAGEAFASGWLERREGKWLQTSDAPSGAIRTRLLDKLAAFAPAPKGYADHGRVKL